jgi:hypothetical protein
LPNDLTNYTDFVKCLDEPRFSPAIRASRGDRVERVERLLERVERLLERVERLLSGPFLAKQSPTGS